MAHVSRAGRKQQIKRVLVQQYRRCGLGGVSAAFISRRIGVRSSTHLKKIIEEMIREDDELFVGLDLRYWNVGYKPLGQTPFDDRFIVVNGTKFKVAIWVLPLMEQV